ncbi:MAG TPA: DUF5666 domain-containing protein [Bryobacteraceae bacterium]|nr:DUF5666 domain-containing protein [Bryobacteraceae bacterium]
MRTLVVTLALAAALAAQPQKSILGTLTEFKMSSLEFGLKPDDGAMTYFTVSSDTDVLQVEPGERDLSRAMKVRVTDLSISDRVMVTFVAGMPEARRIVLISATDISKRNEAERLDWQKRGVSGTVTAIHGEEITLRTGSTQGPPEITAVVTPKTMVRRYAPDSVKFADAQWSKIAEIAVGDQVRTRGNKSADGATMTAEDIVYGTFRSAIGAITAVDTEARTITIADLATKKPLTIRVTADTQLKEMPDFRGMFKNGKPEGHAAQAVSDPQKLDVVKLIEMLPLTKFESLRVGGAVMVTSTRGSSSDQVTATRIISNVNFLIETAAAEGAQRGMTTMETITRMHGGAMSGPGGLSLPAIVP